MAHPFPYNFIAIEGNIGVGKTTLCEMLARDYNCRLILEQFTDNPFLPFFYKEPERYAFPVELFFMTERHKQLQSDLSQQDLFQQLIVSDYFFFKTLLFARNNLSDEEFRLFQRLFNILKTNFPPPEIIVFLHRPVDELLANIKKRNRSYEADITPEYLMNIQNTYYDYFRIEQQIPILIIDVSELDYLNSTKDYELITQALSRKYPPGLHHASFVQ